MSAAPSCAPRGADLPLPPEIDDAPLWDERRCRVCGCTDDDCSQCIERTGAPCSWVDEDLCTACADRMLEAVGDALPYLQHVLTEAECGQEWAAAPVERLGGVARLREICDLLVAFGAP